MSSGKPSVRSRPGSLSRAAPVRSVYDSYREEQEASLDRRTWSQSSSRSDSRSDSRRTGDAQKCVSKSEMGIRVVCEELTELQKTCADSMRKNAYENYGVFIRTSQEISDIEGEVTTMNNMLRSQSDLIRTLAESGASLPLAESTERLSRDYFKDDDEDDEEPTDLAKRIELLPDSLDVLLTERRVDDALALLEEGEALAVRLSKANGGVEGVSGDAIRQFEKNLAERKSGLVVYLVDSVRQLTFRGSELRHAIAALDKLGDGSRAHTLLLQSHEERLKRNINQLRQGGASYGGVYTTAVSQLVFSAIAQASRDSVAVFGEVPSFASELVLWATEVTEMCASVITRNVLLSSAASGSLRAALECVQIALGHCALLEERGLTLCPTLTKLLRPSVEQALQTTLGSILEDVGSLAANDNWTLDVSPQRGSRGIMSNLRLTTSGHRFLSLVQDFLEDYPALVSIQLGQGVLGCVVEIFEQYVHMLVKALPGQEVEEEGKRKVRIAASEDQQLSLLGNAAALVDELVGGAASIILPGGLQSSGDLRVSRTSSLTARSPELKDLRRQLQLHVETLKLNLCNGVIISLCYDDYESKLSATTYFQIDFDVPTWHENPTPTPLFQSIFQKLVSMHQVAGHVLAGKDRVTQLFLIRLTETFVKDLSTNPELWGPIEEDPGSLGPFGLQQFLFDMQFLTVVARNLRCLSRTVFQAISQEEERMKEAYIISGAELTSALPDPAWLQATVLDNFDHLMDQWFGLSGMAPRDVSDVQSVSSTRSND